MEGKSSPSSSTGGSGGPVIGRSVELRQVMADFRAQTEEAGGDRTASGRHALRRVERPKVFWRRFGDWCLVFWIWRS